MEDDYDSNPRTPSLASIAEKIESMQTWNTVGFVVISLFLIGALVLVILSITSIFRPSNQVVAVTGDSIAASTMTVYLLQGSSEKVTITTDMYKGGSITVVNERSADVTITYTNVGSKTYFLKKGASVVFVSASQGYLTTVSEFLNPVVVITGNSITASAMTVYLLQGTLTTVTITANMYKGESITVVNQRSSDVEITYTDAGSNTYTLEKDASIVFVSPSQGSLRPYSLFQGS